MAIMYCEAIFLWGEAIFSACRKSGDPYGMPNTRNANFNLD